MTIKNRIILTFSALTTLLVIVMAWVSYVAVREIYLNQVSQQTLQLTRIVGGALDAKYLTFVDANRPTQGAVMYYREQLQKQAAALSVGNIVIFDAQFNIITQTAGEETGGRDARLQLFANDILQLSVKQATVSLPFRGHDDNWYLWGFYRLDENYWLGVRESAARFAEVAMLPRIFFAIGLAGVALTILAGVWLGGSIAEPIGQMVKFSRRLGAGDFSAQAPASTAGELSILTEAMDKMRHDLANQQREKEAMLAQIAHEIRNPLGGIELLGGLVKEDLQKTAADNRYIDKILTEIGGLKALINAYLNYSRPAPASPEDVQIEEVVAEVIESLGLKLRQKNARLQISGSGQIIRFDRQHLRQVLFNLINNSAEMIGENGSIAVSAGESGGRAFIEIRDSGPGIAPEHLSKIFDPFFTTRADGTGLGLAVCRKLCRENRADITVENLPAGGCKFVITKEK